GAKGHRQQLAPAALQADRGEGGLKGGREENEVQGLEKRGGQHPFPAALGQRARQLADLSQAREDDIEEADNQEAQENTATQSGANIPLWGGRAERVKEKTLRVFPHLRCGQV